MEAKTETEVKTKVETSAPPSSKRDNTLKLYNKETRRLSCRVSKQFLLHLKHDRHCKLYIISAIRPSALNLDTLLLEVDRLGLTVRVSPEDFLRSLPWSPVAFRLQTEKISRGRKEHWKKFYTDIENNLSSLSQFGIRSDTVSNILLHLRLFKNSRLAELVLSTEIYHKPLSLLQIFSRTVTMDSSTKDKNGLGYQVLAVCRLLLSIFCRLISEIEEVQEEEGLTALKAGFREIFLGLPEDFHIFTERDKERSREHRRKDTEFKLKITSDRERDFISLVGESWCKYILPETSRGGFNRVHKWEYPPGFQTFNFFKHSSAAPADLLAYSRQTEVQQEGQEADEEVLAEGPLMETEPITPVEKTLESLFDSIQAPSSPISSGMQEPARQVEVVKQVQQSGQVFDLLQPATKGAAFQTIQLTTDGTAAQLENNMQLGHQQGQGAAAFQMTRSAHQPRLARSILQPSQHLKQLAQQVLEELLQPAADGTTALQPVTDGTMAFQNQPAHQARLARSVLQPSQHPKELARQALEDLLPPAVRPQQSTLQPAVQWPGQQLPTGPSSSTLSLVPSASSSLPRAPSTSSSPPCAPSTSYSLCAPSTSYSLCAPSTSYSLCAPSTSSSLFAPSTSSSLFATSSLFDPSTSSSVEPALFFSSEMIAEQRIEIEKMEEKMEEVLVNRLRFRAIVKCTKNLVKFSV